MNPLIVGTLSFLAGIGLAYVVTRPPRSAEQIARDLKLQGTL